MAADLHIHVLEGITETDLAAFFSHTLGSRWFSSSHPYRSRETIRAVERSPSVWIGEISWLKAALFEDGEETFIPTPVGRVSEIIGEDLPVIDDHLITLIEGAFVMENRTGYDVTKPMPVVTFLREHMGQRVFTVSW